MVSVEMFHAAPPVERVLTVNRLQQHITFDGLQEKSTNDQPFELSATASSGLPIRYLSSNEAVAVITGNVVGITGAGNTIITAHQDGNEQYDPASPVNQILAVNVVTAIAENDDKNDVFVFPNPVLSQTTVSVRMTGSSSVVRACIYDNFGRVVMQHSFTSQYALILDLSLLSGGVYWLNVTNGVVTRWKKIVKN